jgi:hypothetical protein
MARSSPTPTDASGTRDWWLRTLLVLQAPRAVFAALRDDSPEAAGDRAEPVLAIIFLAGIAGVLSTRTAGRLMDDGDYDAILVAVWAFIAGSLYGATGYWLIGGLVHRGGIAMGSAGSYRRARHLVAFAAVPIALSLVLLPVKLALYGADIFRSGGSDSGSGGKVFAALELAFFLWAGALVFVGIRTVHGWSSARAGAAVGAAAALPVAITVLVLTL